MQIISQHILPIPNGNVVATVIRLDSTTDTGLWSRASNMPSSSPWAIAQLRRPGDPAVTVTQTALNQLSVTGNVGDEVLIIAHCDRPIVTTEPPTPTQV